MRLVRSGDAPNRRLAVEFEDVPRASAGEVSFSIVLHEGGAVELHCVACDDVDGVMSGVQASSGAAPVAHAVEVGAALDDRSVLLRTFRGDGAGDLCDACSGGDDRVDTDDNGTPDACEP